ncbi:class I SAM-dependent methyltransferase [Phycicoccus sp.]|uniref:class I SAM-dependent methyltransferase n=1 Tax=Phycicoccus sp. TaxID=1902410 RepID=UPI002C3A6378|nr:class I SAM-dependent methyltransferase [Phycicoccus sp.]HMM93588.1 class I SAM-dependent methyltransferase [Phycicoccus sp.]
MFGDAAAYERFMGRWSTALAPSFLDAVAPVPAPSSACDVGCGTGNLTAELLRRAPDCRVTAVDPAPPFVAAARERLGDAVRVLPGTAEALPLDDDEVDVALALLVLNFVPDPEAGVAEMVRVTRPGGVVGAAVWDYASGMAMLRAFWDAAAALWPGAEDQALDRPAGSGGLEALLTRGGVADVGGGVLEVPMRFATFAEYWDPFLEGIGPAGAYVERLGEVRREELRAELERRLGPGPVEMTSTARWAAGRVAG